MPLLDTYQRPMRTLRISVTDQCNLRCQYCMPEEEYVWLDRREMLTFEEIERLTRIFASLGVDKIRLTGGEPLLRRNLDTLVSMLARVKGVDDLALTTNAILLPRFARELRAAGLRRVTVSMDTLRPERFKALARRDNHAGVLEGITAAREAGFESIKVNTVVIRGFNDDELGELIEFGRGEGVEMRFIEYMDVGGATRWSMDQVVSREQMLSALERRFGGVRPVDEGGSAPADRFELADGTVFGIIASTTRPFCGTCDRGRLTTDGLWLLCLYARDGVDLKRLLRGGATDREIEAAIGEGWRSRTDRGAERRASLASRGTLYTIVDLKRDPHREMHTRGG